MTTERQSLANSAPGSQALGAGTSFGSSPSSSPGSGPPQRSDGGPPQQVVDKAQTEQGRDELRAAGVTDEQIALLRDMPSSSDLPASRPTEEASTLPQNRDATGSSADATNTSDDASKTSLAKEREAQLPSELNRFTDERGTRLSEALGAGVQPEVLGKAGFSGQQISDAAGELERNRFEERRRNATLGEFIAQRDRDQADDKSSESVKPEMSAAEIQAGQAQRGVALFNERVAKQEEKAFKESIAFERSHIKLATGEYVAKTTYNDLSETDQDLLRREGVAKFNERPGQSVATNAPPTLLKTAKEFGLDLVPVYGTIRQARRLEENWEELSTLGKIRDSAFVGLSAVGDVSIVGGLVVRGVGAGAKAADTLSASFTSGREAARIAKATEDARNITVGREIISDTSVKHLGEVRHLVQASPAKARIAVIAGPSESSIKGIGVVTREIQEVRPGAAIDAVLEVRKTPDDIPEIIRALKNENVTSVTLREVRSPNAGATVAEEIRLAKQAGPFAKQAKVLDEIDAKKPPTTGKPEGLNTNQLEDALRDARIKVRKEVDVEGVEVLKPREPGPPSLRRGNTAPTYDIPTTKVPRQEGPRSLRLGQRTTNTETGTLSRKVRLEPEGPMGGRGRVAVLTAPGAPLRYSRVSSGRTYAEQLRLSRGAPLQDFSPKRDSQDTAKVDSVRKPPPFEQPDRRRPATTPATGVGPVPGVITQPRTGAEPRIGPGTDTRQKPGESLQQQTQQSTSTKSGTDTSRSEDTRADTAAEPKPKPGVGTTTSAQTQTPVAPPKLPPILDPDKRPRKQPGDDDRFPAVVEYEQGFTLVTADLRTGERKYRQKTEGEKKAPNSPKDTLKVIEYSPRKPRYRLSFSQGAVKVGVGSSSINFEGKPRSGMRRRGLRGRM